MENISAIFTVIRSLWNNLFGLTYPGLSLTFKQIIIGSFVFMFSVYVLKEVFGIGANVITTAHRRREAETRSRLQSQKNK